MFIQATIVPIIMTQTIKSLFINPPIRSIYENDTNCRIPEQESGTAP